MEKTIIKTLKRWLYRLPLWLPWLAGLGMLAFFWVWAWWAGRSFAAGLHFFRWFMDVILMGMGLLVAWLVSLLAALVLRRRLRRLWKRGPLAMTLTSCLLTVLLMPVMFFGLDHFFFAGREAAYAAVETEPVYRAAKALAEELRRCGESYRSYFGDDPALPEGIRALSPLFVELSPTAVAVGMDGGGIMYAEGVGILLPDPADPDQVRRAEQWMADSAVRPLGTRFTFMYRLDDSRELLGALEE